MGTTIGSNQWMVPGLSRFPSGRRGVGGTATVLVVAVSAVALLEGFLGLCLGSHLFRLRIQLGLAPPETCAAWVNLWGTR